MKVFVFQMKNYSSGKIRLVMRYQSGHVFSEFWRNVPEIIICSIFNTNFFIESFLQISFCSSCIWRTQNIVLFGKIEEESIEHLFFDCGKTFQFWEVFANHLRQCFPDFTLEKKHILLGSRNFCSFLNLLVLIAKKYIYSCKLKEKLPNIVELEFKIKKYYSLEKYIALKNNKLFVFEKYWTPLHHIFP